MSIKWEVVEAKQLNRRIGEPYATFSPSRISLSPAACDLVENVYEKMYVEVRVGRDESGAIRKIGMLFQNQPGENKLLVTRRKYKGEPVAGININSKNLVQLLLGNPNSEETVKYLVEKGGEDLIVIDFEKELK